MRFLLLLACLAGVETGCFAQGNSYFGNFNGNAGFVSTNQPGLSNVVAANIVGTLTNSTTGNAATATTAANATGTLTNNISGSAAYATNAGSAGTATNASYATNAGNAATVTSVLTNSITNGAGLINTPLTGLTNSGGNSGKILTITGTGAIAASNAAAVTSVGLNVDAAGVLSSIVGSPVTTSGSFTPTFNAIIAALSSNNGAGLTNEPLTGLTNSGTNSGLYLTITGTGAIVASNVTATATNIPISLVVYTNWIIIGPGTNSITPYFTNTTGYPIIVNGTFSFTINGAPTVAGVYMEANNGSGFNNQSALSFLYAGTGPTANTMWPISTVVPTNSVFYFTNICGFGSSVSLVSGTGQYTILK